MNIKETSEIIKDSLPFVNFSTDYSSGNVEKPYLAKNLSALRNALDKLDNIELIRPELEQLKKSNLYSNYKDVDIFTGLQSTVITSNVSRIKIGLEFLLRYNNQNEISNTGLYIKLPDLENFDDLAKISNDFKKAIEIPIYDQNDDGYVKITSAESGSIWLSVALGTIGAVNLIGAICWAAAVIRKKKAEAKIFEEHAKTLELKNDSLSLFVNAQVEQLKNIMQGEADAIANKHYSSNGPEVIERLKMSISTVSDLIERGSKILPASDNSDTLKSFPDYSKLNFIESSIRRLTGEN